LKIYRTASGWILEADSRHFLLPPEHTANLTAREDLEKHLRRLSGELKPMNWSVPETLLPPLENQEIWAAGVTYFRSRTARMEEAKSAGGGDFYDRVYSAERPELFFKATPHRVAGSGAAVRIRHDSKWNVPEPELTLLVSPHGKILGYTIGNDVSSRDIEGENPLYLPQAKVYDKSCALGPAILISSERPDASTEIKLEIRRGGQEAFLGTTTLASMKRDPALLVDYLFRENSFPDGCFLMTGTGIVPPDSFTLDHGDEIRISIAGIGTLKNTVE
jgi:2-dehydro-3-deoxy-D-arabinonate dehydratase